MWAVVKEALNQLHPWFISQVRTYVPVGVGAVLGWLASQGVDVSPEFAAQVEYVAIGIGVVAWYLTARTFEQIGASNGWRWLAILGGIMNGYPRPPEYRVNPDNDYPANPDDHQV